MNQFNAKSQLDIRSIRHFIDFIEQDQLSEDQKLILLVALSQHLKNATSLNLFINVLIKKGNYTKSNLGETGIDICGTGGSGLARINTSTLTGILLSTFDIPILKHGNKAASGRFGSFDLLECLNVPIDAEQAAIENAFEAQNLAFLYARKTHPVVGKLAGTRARLGVPTVLNVLGPLLNPYLPKRQFMGTSFADFMGTIFETAIAMGKEHFVLVRAEDGLDEISVSVPTKVMEYIDGKIEIYEISPADFGLEAIPFNAVRSDKKEDNIRIAEEIIKGELKSEHYQLIAINAAFVYAKFHKAMDLKEAYQLMITQIKSGAMKAKLENYSQTILTHGAIA
ncbi:UNVERIFIED_CONTAM: hypothetical protein GTU68_061166 [Idotea baltica]|nr:hypothetical protein [Idotea baltica]